MKYRFLFATLVLSFFGLSFFGLSSCKDDDDKGCSVAWGSELQDEVNAITAAALEYGTNPTTDNCNAYKDAAQDYLDALKTYENCSALTTQERNDLEDAIDAAEAQVNGIVC